MNPIRVLRGEKAPGRRYATGLRLLALCCAAFSWSIGANGPSRVQAQPRVAAQVQPADGAMEEGTIALSSDRLDVRAFVKIVGEHMGIQFVVDDNVEGRITVVTPPVPRAKAFALFVSILESAGCSVVQEGDHYRVVGLPRRGIPMAPVVGPDDPARDIGLITRVFLLRHVGVEEVRRFLESRVPDGQAGSVATVRETNHVIVTDTAQSLKRIERIIAEIDRPGLVRKTRIVQLRHARAEEMAQQLNLAVQESEGRAEQLQRRLPRAPEDNGGRRQGAPAVVPVAHSNSLILVGSPAQLDLLQSLVNEMDVEAPTVHGRLNAIFLKYMRADDAAESLNNLLAKGERDERPGARGRHIMAIEASPHNNALLVDAAPGDFAVIQGLIEQIDLAPEQVMISVVIAEQTVRDGKTLGFDILAMSRPSAGDTTVLQGASLMRDDAESFMDAIQRGIFPRGITIGVAEGGLGTDAQGRAIIGYPGLLTMEALLETGGFRIRSETALETQNNRKATIDIVDEIPILESTIEGTGTARDVIRNVERIDVGIKLGLTPQIVPGGEVQMALNTSIEAVKDPGPPGQFSPTIAKREVETTVTVPDGRTIVIAGLTRDDESQQTRRVPFLGRIPLAGALFRRTVDVSEKTNLLILVTPRIVTDGAAARAELEAWKERTGLEQDRP